jgi:hypothetical protein
MSDGPHKSLPMRPAWRRVAALAANPNSAPDEIRSAVRPALRHDWHQGLPAQLVRDVGQILCDPPPLFSDDTIRRLESLRRSTPPNGLGDLLLDCATERAISRAGGREALVAAVVQALAVWASRCGYQIEEHILRKSPTPTSENIRARIEEGMSGAPFAELARELIDREPGSASRDPLKQEDLDDGVPL